MQKIDRILSTIKCGTEEIILEEELIKKLEENRSLIIKFGCDPTAPDIHLGHVVILKKLRELQNLGHEVHFLIGDFTAQIGDPTGKNKTRPVLSSLEVKNNSSTYKDQAFKILDRKKTIIRYNGDWFNFMNANDIIKLASKQTVARMLEREDFSKRYSLGKSISIHEFLYPLIHGYDSVAISADIEIGGTDQKFNMLMGRELQRQKGQAPQVTITMPLCMGVDGINKMSKSSKNYISLNEDPDEMFGKIMSISDTLMWHYYKLLSSKNSAEIQSLKRSVAEGENPRNIKFKLAKDIVTQFHSKTLSQQSYENFIRLFQKKRTPKNVPEIEMSLIKGKIRLTNLLKITNLVPSTSEAIRMISQGAVKIDGCKINDIKFTLSCNTSSNLQVGKRKFIKVILT